MTTDLVHVSGSDLSGRIVRREIPMSEEYRRLYGSQVNMDLIEQAVRNAESGMMADLCDLETEMMKNDGHLSSVLSKRVGALEAADWDLTPPQGIDRGDKKAAEEICTKVNTILRAIPFFGERISDLAWATYDGRSALEIHWAPGAHGLRMAPVDLQWVHPRRLAFGPRREMRIVDTWRASSGFSEQGIALEDHPGKFVSWTPRLFREYPEREGLGPRALYWCFFKRFSWRYRMKLTELFGLPWRIVEVDKDSPAQPESITQAKEDAEKLGGENTAAFDRGLKLKVEWPVEGSHDIFTITSDQVDSQISKLVLGNPGTTDAVANRAESIVHRGEQDIIVQRDGNGCGARIQHHLVRRIVLTGYGPDAMHLCPLFQLRTQPQRDRKSELERVDKVLSFGLAVPESYVREASGIRPPADGEAFIQKGASKGVDQFGNPLPGGYEVVDPSKPTPPAGPASPPAAGAGGGEGEEPPGPGDEGTPEGDGPDGAAAGALRDLLGLEREAGGYFELGASDGPKALPANAVHGSPETLVAKGLREGMRSVEAWTASLLDACDGATTAPQLYRRLEKATASLDLEGLARALERRMLHSLALGALDSDWESENDRVIKPPAFALDRPEEEWEPLELDAVSGDFAAKPFAEALKFFRAKNVLSRRAFDRLGAEAKRRAFTIAGLASKRLLEVAHSEIARQLEQGGDLRAFRAALQERIGLAGWAKDNPSHVEVVFRNAVGGAYASGRDVQMRQPEVLAARPYWQILGVGDARCRATHKAAHRKVLRADDSFWQRAPLPWGHNERCRKVARSAEAVKKLGLEVVAGSSLQGLPDEGWDGSSTLLESARGDVWIDEPAETPEPAELPFASRSAAYLADLAEYRALGVTPDMAALARLHGVPPPKES